LTLAPLTKQTADLVLTYDKDGWTHEIKGKVQDVDLSVDVEYNDPEFFGMDSYSRYAVNRQTTLTFIPTENGADVVYTQRKNFPQTVTTRIHIPKLNEANIAKARAQAGVDKEAEFHIENEDGDISLVFYWSTGTDE
jgi:hypothetical protein